MQNYLKQYVVILCTMLLAMFTYRWVVVPAIEPLRPVQVEPIAFSAELLETQWWQRLFPSQAWQNAQPKILQTARGIILFKEWEQLGPDRWQLKPLTMIIPQGPTDEPVTTVVADSEHLTDQDVWVVNADAGAIIQFREAFDWTKGRTPPVTGGRLVGQIGITRHSKNQTSENPWSLETRDIHIDQRRVWTIEPVEIRWGSSRIRGRDLSIYLKQDLLDGTPDDPSPWGVLENMELIYVDEINVGLPPGGLWADRKQSSPNLPVIQGLPANLRVESGGPFRFDFIGSQASLMNGVHVVHQLGTLPPDQFWSQEVQVKLEPQSPATLAQPAKHSAVALGGLWLKQFTARGVDPVGPITGQAIVQLDAPNIGAAARAKRLNVNFVDDQIELIGRLESPQAVNTVAMLDYLGYAFRSPLIQYRRDPQGNHLGWLAAEGPGEVLVPADSSLGQCNIRWQQSLAMKPDGADQWLSLVGKILIESKIHGFMTSDAVDLWLKPNPNALAKASVAPPAESSQPGRAAGSLDSQSYLPDRLRATGSVTLASAQIKAMVDELKLWLVHAPDKVPTSQDALPLSDSAGNPMYQFVKPPASDGTPANLAGVTPIIAEAGVNPAFTGTATQVVPMLSSAASGTGTGSSLRTDPIIVEGTSLQTRIIASSTQSWIDTLTIDGPLHVYRDSHVSDAKLWNIEGQQLQLSTNAAGQADVQIAGSPAKIGVGEAWLVGPLVRYDQRTGLIWMDQPGEFTLPTTPLNGSQASAGTNSSPTSNLRWLKAPHCKWKGRLLFDGAVARIEGDIEFTGVVSPESDRLWFVDGFCQQLDIHLQHPIDMRAPKAGAAADLERVVLSNSVDLRAAQTDARGNRLSLQRLMVPTLTFHMPHNQIVGAGPGWIRSWHTSQPKLSPVTTSTDVRIQPPPELLGAHLVFRESMVAFMDRTEVVFEGKVELAAGPLQSWEDMIDLNTMQSLKPDQMLLSCDLLKAYDTSDLNAAPTTYASTSGPTIGNSPSSAAWEVQALGNVRFSGKSTKGDYSGNGYRVTYTQAKDRMLLEGDGRTAARVKLIPADTSQLEFDVISAAFNVKTLATQEFRLTRASGTAPSASPAQSSNTPTTPNSSSPRSGVSDWLRPKQ